MRSGSCRLATLCSVLCCGGALAVRAGPLRLQFDAVRAGPLRLQFDDVPLVTSSLLFQDNKQATSRAAHREGVLMDPNSKLLDPPDPKRRFDPRGKAGRFAKGKSKVKARGGGFAAGTSLTTAERANALRADTVAADGICLVEDVLSTESASKLLGAAQDELSRAYASVERDPQTAVARFNVAPETFDPLRGYLLLPLRDEQSVADGVKWGPIVSALDELLQPGTKLGELFSDTCGGDSAEFYDLVCLRTEAGAARQPIHFDTPFQKTPGLFCAFIAMHDVAYTQGTTVFIPGTPT